MTQVDPSTRFASAGRQPVEQLRVQHERITDLNFFDGIVSTMPNLLLVLNGDRQIVYGNHAALRFLGVTGIDPVLGARPGEAVNCLNAHGEGGCGTDEKCSTCGAVLAILAAQGGESDSRECRILVKSGDRTEAIDLRVHAAPLEAGGERFVAFYLADISHEKRRRVLERIFFHDVLNTAGVLKAYSEELIDESDPSAVRGIGGTLTRVSRRLVDEIKEQRELLRAESGELTPVLRPVHVRDLLQALAEAYASHDVARGKSIVVRPGPDLLLQSDETLLERVLGNMLKNALEASVGGETVSLEVHDEGTEAVFHVQNPAVMPREVKLQVFNRSFSTKGADRGLGTYSMKLLSERYLGGRVGFTSEAGQGTCFTLRLPLA